MDKEKYIMAVWEQAGTATKEYYYKDRRGWTYNIGSSVLVAIISPIIYRALGLIMANQLWLSVLAGIASGVIFLIIWFLGVCIYNLATAPAKIYYKQKESEKKLSDELEKLKVKPLTYPLLAYHAEYKIKNAGAKRVADYIRQDLLSILGFINTGTLYYETNLEEMQYYDPEKNNTLRHGIVMPGLIYGVKPAMGEALQLINGRNIDELFIVSVVSGSQSNSKTCLVNFDTNIRDIYAPMSNSLKDGLMKVFDLEIIEDEKIKPWETFKKEFPIV